MVNFVQRLRDEKKFSGIPELVEQIDRDIAEARLIWPPILKAKAKASWKFVLHPKLGNRSLGPPPRAVSSPIPSKSNSVLRNTGISGCPSHLFSFENPKICVSLTGWPAITTIKKGWTQ
jgi:hypothetical protein